MENPRLGSSSGNRGEGRMHRGGREGIGAPGAQPGGQGPLGTGGRSQRAASVGRTESVATTVPSHFSLALPHPADNIFQQGRWSLTPRSVTEQDLAQQPLRQEPRSPRRQLSASLWQTRGRPTKQHHRLTDPPGPQEHLCPLQSKAQSPPSCTGAGAGEQAQAPTTPLTPTPFQAARPKTKNPPDFTEFTASSSVVARPADSHPVPPKAELVPRESHARALTHWSRSDCVYNRPGPEPPWT